MPEYKQSFGFPPRPSKAMYVLSDGRDRLICESRLMSCVQLSHLDGTCQSISVSTLGKTGMRIPWSGVLLDVYVASEGPDPILRYLHLIQQQQQVGFN